MSEDTFTVITRESLPAAIRSGRGNILPETAAVLATVGTLDAIRIILDGRSHLKVATRLRNTAKAHGLKVRSRYVRDGHLYAWAEHRSNNGHHAA